MPTSPTSAQSTRCLLLSAQDTQIFFPSLTQPSSFPTQSLCIVSLLPGTLCSWIFPWLHPSIILASVEMSPLHTGLPEYTSQKSLANTAIHHSISYCHILLSSESLSPSGIIICPDDYHLSPPSHSTIFQRIRPTRAGTVPVLFVPRGPVLTGSGTQ